MQRSDFNFDLPKALIAQSPPQKRTDSRLLYLQRDSGALVDAQFPDILDLVDSGDLLVFNDTRVIPARLYGHKETGGQVEILVERVLNDKQITALVRASKSPKPGSIITLEGDACLLVEGRDDAYFHLSLQGEASVMQILDQQGHMPLPPYIERGDNIEDRERYQTVYAHKLGAVAAPTAGLHFDEPLMQRLKDKGVESAFVTLHVGSGTFQPVRVDDIQSHNMHSEYISVSESVCEQVNRVRNNGGKVIAVGTTAVRCLETAAQNRRLQAYTGDTDIFIFPGYQFKLVDAMITNFHLPESTLLMLVCAFAGMENTLKAYQHAVNKEYRFFSYGDAMFIQGVAQDAKNNRSNVADET